MCKNNKYDVPFENTFMITSNIEKSHKYDFDIFKLREYTNRHELLTILPYVLAKHGLIGAC